MTEFKDKTFLEVLQTYIYEVERVTGQKPLELYLDCRLEDFFYHDLNRLCLAQYSKCKPEKNDSKFMGINIISLIEFKKLQAENAELRKDKEWLISALQNFYPFNGNLTEGLDATMYQTLSFEGDNKLLFKFLEIKNTGSGESGGE